MVHRQNIMSLHALKMAVEEKKPSTKIINTEYKQVECNGGIYTEKILHHYTLL